MVLLRSHIYWAKRLLLIFTAAAMALTGCQPAPAPVEVTVTPTARATARPGSQRTAMPAGTLPVQTPALPQASRIGVDPDDLKGINILFWHPWSGAAAAEVEALARDFNRSNAWGLQAQVSAFTGHGGVLEALEASGDGSVLPDILVAPIYHLRSIIDGNGAAPLTDLKPYLQDSTWGIAAAEQEAYFPVFWQQGFDGERRYAIPAQMSGSLIYYNQTWARELGFASPPRTAAEFEEQACAAASANQMDDQRDNDGSGGWIVNTSYPAALSWLYAYGAEIQDPLDGYRFNITPVRQSFTFLRELYEQGCAWLPEDEFVEEEFASRLGLFASGSVLGIPYQEDAFADAGSKDDWIVLPYPGGVGRGAVTVYGDAYALASTTPQRQLAAWLFVRWMLQPENQARLIVKTGAYPLSNAALVEVLPHKPLKQWQQAVDLLEVAHSEPQLTSWLAVRWAVSDVTSQLFRWYFTLDQLPAAVRLLDQTAAELHQRSAGTSGTAP